MSGKDTSGFVAKSGEELTNEIIGAIEARVTKEIGPRIIDKHDTEKYLSKFVRLLLI